MDALKAALAALQSGKGTNPPEGGKNLPVDGAAVGTELPEGVAVLLNGAQGCGARECAAENASTDGPSAAAPGKQDQAAPAVVDGQASIPMPVVMVVPPPPPQPLSPPPAATGGGAEHADAAALALQGAVIRGAAQQAHTPQSGVLMESLEASAAKRAPGPVVPRRWRI
ncbi:hypothetical protein [Methylogaea oryzae]|uniref:hypothetical protein n=1 Tax=Methylogaea oryzae TaxID=1295382 RepID=UPI0012E2F352|nr:hypothetical protein [Methylogaea oryzae]